MLTKERTWWKPSHIPSKITGNSPQSNTVQKREAGTQNKLAIRWKKSEHSITSLLFLLCSSWLCIAHTCEFPCFKIIQQMRSQPMWNFFHARGIRKKMTRENDVHRDRQEVGRFFFSEIFCETVESKKFLPSKRIERVLENRSSKRA